MSSVWACLKSTPEIAMRSLHCPPRGGTLGAFVAPVWLESCLESSKITQDEPGGARTSQEMPVYYGRLRKYNAKALARHQQKKLPRTFCSKELIGILRSSQELTRTPTSL